MGSLVNADLVMAGGGVRGIALVGAASHLEQTGYTFPRCAGTSAGAIVAALIASGMPDLDRQKVMRDVDYVRFRDHTFLDRFGPAGKLTQAIFSKGIYKGDYLHKWISDLLASQGVRTFRDLQQHDPNSSLPLNQQYKLVVMVSDVSTGSLLRLPWDYPEYGLDPNEQPVADAIRASMSVPYFFQPARLGDSFLVDGGMLSNFPISIFDRTDGQPPRWPTIGIKLSGSVGPSEVTNHVRGAFSLGVALVHTMMTFYDRQHINDPDVIKRTIFVDTLGVPTLDFGIKRATQDRLFASGKEAAVEFLKRSE